MLGLRPPFGAASIAASVPLDSNGFPVKQYSTRYHRGESARVWGLETGFTDSIYYPDHQNIRRSHSFHGGDGMRRQSPRPTNWGKFRNTIGEEMGPFKHVSDSVMSFSPRSLSPRESMRKDQNLEAYEYKAPLTQDIKDLRNHKFWYVNFEYKPKPTSVNGFWHWNTSFRPCTQLSDFPRYEGTKEVSQHERIGELSSPELSPRSRSPRSPRRSGSPPRGRSPEIEGRAVGPALPRKVASMHNLGAEFGNFAREKKKSLSNLAHSSVLFDGARESGRESGSRGSGYGLVKNERHRKVAEGMKRLSESIPTYNDKKRAPARRYRKYLTTSLSSCKRASHLIPEMVDSAVNIGLRDGHWPQERKPKEWGF